MEEIPNYPENQKQFEGQPRPPMPQPENNMVLAIITTVCCCIPFGIVGIIYASKVHSYYYTRQYALALQAADNAKKWSLIGIGLGIVGWLLYSLTNVIPLIYILKDL